MKIAVRRSAIQLAPCLLAGALALSLNAHAAIVENGATHTILPGDPLDGWTVRNGATLILAPGAAARSISVGSQSHLQMTDADVAGGMFQAIGLGSSSATIIASRIVSDGSVGLSAGSNPANPTLPASSVSVASSYISGFTAGIVLAGHSDLTLANSTVEGRRQGTGADENGNGLNIYQGTANIMQGSIVRGEQHGALVRSDQLAGKPDGPSVLIVDGSRIEGTSGSAIYVGSLGFEDTDAVITLRNGAELVAGNGVLIDIQSESLDPALKVHADVDVSNSQLRGDMRAGAGTTGSLALRDNASLVGGITGAIDVALSQGGQWQLNKNSDVANLSVGNGGVVALGDGSAFHTLNVAGNFSGTDGTILFNTVLAGDDAASDKLVIGGDTSGQTNVRVNNVGGAGAQTVNGIELITVAGASNGQFDLAGRAVGGQYEYFLFKNAGNWYLRSQLPTAPDPCDTDPTLPECNPVNPEPVLRPEGGAYLANLQSAQNMFRLGYHDRHAGQNSGRAWARVDGARTGFDAVSQQLDVQGNSQSLSVGADVWRNDTGSGVGVMLSSGNATSTSTNALTGYYARGKVKGEALAVYGTWRAGNAVDPYAGFYVDGSVQRAQFRNRVEGVGLDAERYDSRGWQGAIETGYAFRVGGAQAGGIFLEPQLQVGYNRWDDLRHTEANGTVVTTQDADGLYGRVGLRLSGVTRWGDGAADVQPYIAANWLHTRAESQVWMDDERVDARIPRSRAEVSAGASLKFANGFGAWAGLARQQASGYHQTSAQLGMSYSW